MPFIANIDAELGYTDERSEESRTVCHVSIDIADGEIVGLTGVSGSGKTTILRALAGLNQPISGAIRWREGASGFVSYCPQEDVLFDYRNVWENAVLLLESPRTRPRDVQSQLDFVTEALKIVRLFEECGRFPGELSGGMRQRLQVVQSLAAFCEIALLDEPFSQQDRDQQYLMEDLIWGTLRARRRAAVIVSHDVDALTAVCDRVIFLGGRPASVASVVRTPEVLKERGGIGRRSDPQFEAFSAALWSERAKAALI